MYELIVFLKTGKVMHYGQYHSEELAEAVLRLLTPTHYAFHVAIKLDLSVD